MNDLKDLTRKNTKVDQNSIHEFVDRLDIHPQEGVEVIDYKFSSKNSITKKKNNLQDDPQLVIYAKAVNEHDMVNRQPTTTASWISVKEDDSRVEVDDLQSEMKELPAQMIADIESLWGGSPMAASAPDRRTSLWARRRNSSGLGSTAT